MGLPRRILRLVSFGKTERGDEGCRCRDLRFVLDLDDQARIAFELRKGRENRVPADGPFAKAPMAVGISIGVLQMHMLKAIAGAHFPTDGSVRFGRPGHTRYGTFSARKPTRLDPYKT